ncbi:hypothetical protein LINGRAHAP2_LOCUS24704 [Linum grandiflorum]
MLELRDSRQQHRLRILRVHHQGC